MMQREIVTEALQQMADRSDNISVFLVSMNFVLVTGRWKAEKREDTRRETDEIS